MGIFLLFIFCWVVIILIVRQGNNNQAKDTEDIRFIDGLTTEFQLIPNENSKKLALAIRKLMIDPDKPNVKGWPYINLELTKLIVSKILQNQFTTLDEIDEYIMKDEILNKWYVGKA